MITIKNEIRAHHFPRKYQVYRENDGQGVVWKIRYIDKDGHTHDLFYFALKRGKAVDRAYEYARFGNVPVEVVL